MLSLGSNEDQSVVKEQEYETLVAPAGAPKPYQSLNEA
jgi:hypothetical protein